MGADTSIFVLSFRIGEIKLTAIAIISCEETYQNLKTFKNVDQLNNAIRNHKDLHRGKLTKSAINVLDFIHRYSAKYPGVSFLNKNSIATKLKISRRTVIRACNLLETLGIIRQYKMKRKTDMLQTSNAIVIQPIKTEQSKDVTQDTPTLSHQKNKIFLKQNLNNSHLNVKRASYIKHVPKSLQHFQALFGHLIKKLYSRVWLAAKKLKISVDKKVVQLIGFKVMEQLKRYLKKGDHLNEDQLCKLAYKIAYNQLEQCLDKGEILDTRDLYFLINQFKDKQPYIPSLNQSTKNELDELGVF